MSDDIDLIKEIAKDLKEFRKETNQKIDYLKDRIAAVDLAHKILCKDMEVIKDQDHRQNDLIAEHIEGVRQVREQNVNFNREVNRKLDSEIHKISKRLEHIEAPSKWLKGTLWVVGALSTMVLAYNAIVQLVSGS